MDTTENTTRRDSFALHAVLWGLLVTLLLVGGWAFVGVTPLDVFASVVQAFRDMWAALTDFAGWLFGPFVSLFN